MHVQWRKCFAFGKPIARADLGLQGTGSLLITIRRLPMGWTCAVDVAQAIARALFFNEAAVLLSIGVQKSTTCDNRPGSYLRLLG